MPHFRPSLSSLPLELIEEIIIISTLLGDARAPSTLAQTCRPFRTLVYHQLHKHLWREMFLILFDDPRPALDVRALGRAPQPRQRNPTNKGSKGKSENCLSSHDFPWENEYKLRIWAESFILRRTRPPLSAYLSSRDASSDLPSTDAELYTVLDTLHRVVSTAAPLPYDEVAIMTSYCHTSLSHPHPILSPLSLAAHTLPSLVWGSRNTSWLARVLAHGLPRVLMSRLSAYDGNGEIYFQKNPVMWDGLLTKLVAQVGLMTPIKSTTCPAVRPDHTETGHNGNGEERESDIDSDEGLGTPATISLGDLRRLARVRVFNLSYLSPSRSFGPFHPLEVPEASTMRPGSSSPTAIPPIPPIPDLNLDSCGFSPLLDDAAGRDNYNDETDGDENPPADGSSSFFSFFVLILIPAGDGSETLISLVHLIKATDSSTPGMYSSDTLSDQLLHIDWAWIAAARLVIEFNLRDLLRSDRHRGVLRAVLSLQGLRSCSAPGFPPTPPEAAVVGEGEGGRTFKDGEGWDWAGVEGQWRCVILYLRLGTYSVLKIDLGQPTDDFSVRWIIAS